MRIDTDKPYLVVTAFCAIALALRAWVANDAFWLDEIWSYRLTQLMSNWWDAFTVIRIDNNHLLNTLTMHWLGEQANWSVYRLPAVIYGVLTVALMSPAARLIGARPWIAMLLATVSIPLIQYSAEARGYSGAALFGLASWYIYFARLQKTTPPGWLATFWAVSLLGILSHLTFVIVLAALCAAWVLDYARNAPDRGTLIRNGLMALLPAVVMFGTVYLYFYRISGVGGGASSLRLLPNLLDLMGFTVGAPRATSAQVVATMLSAGIAGYGVWRLPANLRPFFVLVLLVLPGLLLAVYQPEFFYPRYFFVCLPFLYLLLARALGDFLADRFALRLIGAAALTCVVLGSAAQYRELLRWGKGDYPQAVEDLYTGTAAERFTVGSDFDFRNKALLDFYTRYRDDAERLVYIERAYERTEPTDYFIVHSQNSAPATELLSLQSGDYSLVAEYPYYGLSGWNWYVYRYNQ